MPLLLRAASLCSLISANLLEAVWVLISGLLVYFIFLLMQRLPSPILPFISSIPLCDYHTLADQKCLRPYLYLLKNFFSVYVYLTERFCVYSVLNNYLLAYMLQGAGLFSLRHLSNSANAVLKVHSKLELLAMLALACFVKTWRETSKRPTKSFYLASLLWNFDIVTFCHFCVCIPSILISSLVHMYIAD